VDTVILREGFEIKIINPALCLISRLNNLYSLGYGKYKKEREVIRIIIAINITKNYFNDLLEHPCQRRKALNIASLILDTANKHWCLNLCVRYTLDLLRAIPAQNPNFGERFKNGHYLAMKEKINSRKDSKYKKIQKANTKSI